MLTKNAYAYYEAGAAVAAVHCRLKVRLVSINPARGRTSIAIPRGSRKDRITLWLAGLAAEKKGVGETDPFRRMKNRQRIGEELAAWAKELDGPETQRDQGARRLLGQAQDRANAICAGLFPAIEKIAVMLIEKEAAAGADVETIVRETRLALRRQNPPNDLPE